MNQNLLSRVLEFLGRKMWSRRWQRAVTCLAAVAVFGVTYALVLPAITMTNVYPRLSAEELSAWSGEELTVKVTAEADGEGTEKIFVLKAKGEGADLSASYAFNEEGICVITDEEGKEIELHRSIRESEKDVVDYWFTLEAGTKTVFTLDLIDEEDEGRFAELVEAVKQNENKEEEAETASASNAGKSGAAAAKSGSGRSGATASNAGKSTASNADVAEANAAAKTSEEKIVVEKDDDGFEQILDGAIVNDLEVEEDEDAGQTEITATLKLSAGIGSELEDAVKDAEKNADKRGDAELVFSWKNVAASGAAAAELVWEGEGAHIAVFHDADANIPAGAYLSVREIGQDSEDYRHYYDQASFAVADPADANSMKAVRYARFFDITILDSEDNEVEPESPVKVVITYDDEIPTAREGGLNVVHFRENEEADVYNDSDLEGGADKKAVSFTTDSFSVYALVSTETLKGDVKTESGETYEVTVAYGPDAELPDGAELNVREIPENSDIYQKYYAQAEAALTELADETVKVKYSRLFDISFSLNGEEIEPKGQTQVSIVLKDAPAPAENQEVNAVHFANEKVEVLETAEKGAEDLADGIHFRTDSFSVYGVLVLERTEETVSVTGVVPVQKKHSGTFKRLAGNITISISERIAAQDKISIEAPDYKVFLNGGTDPIAEGSLADKLVYSTETNVQVGGEYPVDATPVAFFKSVENGESYTLLPCAENGTELTGGTLLYTGTIEEVKEVKIGVTTIRTTRLMPMAAGGQSNLTTYDYMSAVDEYVKTVWGVPGDTIELKDITSSNEFYYEVNPNTTQTERRSAATLNSCTLVTIVDDGSGNYSLQPVDAEGNPVANAKVYMVYDRLYQFNVIANDVVLEHSEDDGNAWLWNGDGYAEYESTEYYFNRDHMVYKPFPVTLNKKTINYPGVGQKTLRVIGRVGDQFSALDLGYERILYAGLDAVNGVPQNTEIEWYALDADKINGTPAYVSPGGQTGTLEDYEWKGAGNNVNDTTHTSDVDYLSGETGPFINSTTVNNWYYTTHFEGGQNQWQKQYWDVTRHPSDGGNTGQRGVTPYLISNYLILNSYNDKVYFFEIVEDANGTPILQVKHANGNTYTLSGKETTRTFDRDNTANGTFTTTIYGKEGEGIGLYTTREALLFPNLPVKSGSVRNPNHVQLRMPSTVEFYDDNGICYTGEFQLVKGHLHGEWWPISYESNPDKKMPLFRNSAGTNVYDLDVEPENAQEAKSASVNKSVTVSLDRKFNPKNIKVTVTYFFKGTLTGSDGSTRTYTQENPYQYTVFLDRNMLREAYYACPNQGGYDVILNLAEAMKRVIENKDDVTLMKLWDDYSNKYQFRPSSVTYTIERSRDGQTNWEEFPNNKVVIDGGSTDAAWIQVTGLEQWQDKDGVWHPHHYRVKSETYTTPTGMPSDIQYTPTYDGLSVTNSLQLPTETVSGKKVWKDADGDPLEEGIPDTLTIGLYQLRQGETAPTEADPGRFYDTREAKATGDWEFEFKDLPKYYEENGELKAYDYEVAEYNDGDLLDDFAASFSTNETTGAVTITNKYTPKVNFKKVCDVNPDNTKLEGAVFDIYTKDGDTRKILYQQAISNSDGMICTSDLAAIIERKLDEGVEYFMEEKRAPRGYAMVAGEIKIVRNGSTVTVTYPEYEGVSKVIQYSLNGRQTGTIEVQIENSMGVALPHTGGPGTLMYTLSGLMILIASAVMYGFRRRHEERRSA